MKATSGWVIIPKELILCENCKYHREGFCIHLHWDLSKITYPATSSDDYCSFAEKDEHE